MQVARYWRLKQHLYQLTVEVKEADADTVVMDDPAPVLEQPEGTVAVVFEEKLPVVA